MVLLRVQFRFDDAVKTSFIVDAKIKKAYLLTGKFLLIIIDLLDEIESDLEELPEAVNGLSSADESIFQLHSCQ